MDIQGRRILVTGATGGIGTATVRALLSAGASHVGLLARDPDQLARTITELDAREAAQGGVMPLAADVRNTDAISTAVADFAARADGLDALVNCAGVLLPGAVVSFSFAGLKRYPLDHWDQTLAVNLTGLFLCCQAVIEQMLKRRTKGVIVNLSSLSRQGDAGHAAYSAAKGAVASLTQSLAQELKPAGIRCVAIAPGMIDTPMTEQVPPAYRDQMLKRIAVGRLGTPAEVAHAVRFCIENDFFNGRVLELDGGTY